MVTDEGAVGGDKTYGGALSEKEAMQLEEDFATWKEAKENYEKPEVKIPTAIWLGIIPAWAYGVWYVKQVAMYQAMLLPTGLISFSPAGFTCTVVLIGAVVGLATMVPMWLGGLSGEKHGRKSAREIESMDWNKQDDVRRFAKWMRKLVGGGLAHYARINSVLRVVTFGAAVVVSLVVSYVWGFSEANARTWFAVVQSVSPSGELMNTAVVLDEQESRVICYTMDPKLTPGFVVLPYPDGKGTSLWVHEIGRYWDWFGRLQQDLSIRKSEKSGSSESG